MSEISNELNDQPLVSAGANTTPFPRGPFGAIIMDPPWEYSQKLGRGKDAGQTTRGGLPYESMSLAEIRALPVGEAAERDCALLLWTTNSHLPAALGLIADWNFTYRTLMTWGKDRIGLGYWLRSQTEHCILATRGHPRQKFDGPHGGRTGKAWSTLLLSPRREHSQKPGEVWVMVEDLFVGPYLEIFARHHRQGWTAWGDQVPVWTQATLREPVQQSLGVEEVED